MGYYGRLEYLPMSSVYVVLLNWNGWGDTIECLESIFRVVSPEFRVLVCDNASSDSSLDHIKSWAEGRLSPLAASGSRHGGGASHSVRKPIRFVEYDRAEAESGGAEGECVPLVLVRNGENLGFAGGNNVGIRYALARDDFDYVWLLNNDTVVEPESLAHLVERMRETPDAGMCGSTLLYYDRPEKVQALGGGYYCKWIGLPWHQGRLRRADQIRNRDRAERWMNYIVGASMLVSKEFLRDVGLMCEDYFLYFEETDWALRAKGKFRLVYAPESVVYHKVGASIGTSSNPVNKSMTCDFYNVRNRLLFSKRFFPYALPTVYLVLLGTLLSRLYMRKWDRAKMILRLFVNFNQIDCRPK